jgi:hypothetical protein
MLSCQGHSQSRTQDHDGQIHVEHVNEESDEGGARRSLSGIVCRSVGLQTLTERNCL